MQERNFLLLQQVHSKTNELTRLSEEKSKLNDLVNDLETTAEEHDAASKCLRSELHSQKTKMTDLEETVTKLRSENQDLLEMQRSRRLESLDKQSKIDELEKKSANDEERIAFFKREITRLEKSNSDLKNQVEQMKDKISCQKVPFLFFLFSIKLVLFNSSS